MTEAETTSAAPTTSSVSKAIFQTVQVIGLCLLAELPWLAVLTGGMILIEAVEMNWGMRIVFIVMNALASIPIEDTIKMTSYHRVILRKARRINSESRYSMSRYV